MLHRRTVGFARQRHEPAHRLHHEVITRLVAARPVLPETADRAIDEAGIALRQAGVIEPELGQLARQEILDHHVRAARQRGDPLKIVCVSEIGSDATLPAVAAMIIGRLARAILALHEGRPPQAGTVALGRLDLDHVRAQIGERLAGPWPCEDAGKFEHLEPREGRSRIARFIEPHASVAAAPVPAGQAGRITSPASGRSRCDRGPVPCSETPWRAPSPLPRD